MDLQTFIINFTSFLNLVVQFLLGLAFVLFVINAIRFFVFQGNNEDGRDKAKNLALYSVAAFVLIVVFWGVVNLLVSSLLLDCSGIEGREISSDYVTRDAVGPMQSPCQ